MRRYVDFTMKSLFHVILRSAVAVGVCKCFTTSTTTTRDRLCSLSSSRTYYVYSIQSEFNLYAHRGHIIDWLVHVMVRSAVVVGEHKCFTITTSSITTTITAQALL